MEIRGTSAIVTYNVCAMFGIMPKNSTVYTCSKCKLVAVLEKKMKEIEQ